MIVVKIGGAGGVNLDAICQDAALHIQSGERLLLVHGGSVETNEISTRLGYPPRMVTSISGFTSRYTDRQTLEIFAMVVAGKLNTLIVERLQQAGVNAFGLSGLDGRMMIARRKEAIRIIENGRQRMLRNDFTGKIEAVNTDLLQLLLQAGLVPVVAPLACSPEGIALNVDADRAAAMLAGAVAARQLILLTNVPGLMRNFPDESTVIRRLAKPQLQQALSLVEGRMKKKVLGASEALDLGVRQVIIADGRIPQPIQNALQGNGTVISQ